MIVWRQIRKHPTLALRCAFWVVVKAIGVTLLTFLAVMALLLLSGETFAREQTHGQREFRKTVPCPGTGRTRKACPGFVIDHIEPLCAGGPDTLDNLQWQEQAASYKKDVLERRLCRRLKQQK